MNLLKILFLNSLFLFSSSLFGQLDSTKISGVNISRSDSEINTIPTIVYKEKEENFSGVQFFLDGKKIDKQYLNALNPNTIEKMEVIKGGTKRDSLDLNHIRIKLRDEYKPGFISLNDLQKKHFNHIESPLIYMLDNVVIQSEHADYYVDEKYLLKIVIEKIEKTGISVHLIRLLTRSKENLEEANTIIPRGAMSYKEASILRKQ